MIEGIVVYIILGLLFQLYMSHHFSWEDGTTVWRKLFTISLCVIGWPVVIVFLALDGL